jgi:hypothetical protein
VFIPPSKGNKIKLYNTIEKYESNLIGNTYVVHCEWILNMYFLSLLNLDSALELVERVVANGLIGVQKHERSWSSILRHV